MNIQLGKRVISLVVIVLGHGEQKMENANILKK
jgi:hypothetical protein